LDDTWFHKPDVPLAQKIAHGAWPKFLSLLCNKPGKEVLEVGSRKVTPGGNLRALFDKAQYTGFDYHPGENVDIVGDAHKLSSYFRYWITLEFGMITCDEKFGASPTLPRQTNYAHRPARL